MCRNVRRAPYQRHAAPHRGRGQYRQTHRRAHFAASKQQGAWAVWDGTKAGCDVKNPRLAAFRRPPISASAQPSCRLVRQFAVCNCKRGCCGHCIRAARHWDGRDSANYIRDCGAVWQGGDEGVGHPGRLCGAHGVCLCTCVARRPAHLLTRPHACADCSAEFRPVSDGQGAQ